MGFEVAKCGISDCVKADTCGYSQSKQNIWYDFKAVCKNQNMYFEHFEGDWRDTKVEQEVEIEKIDTVE